MKKLKILTGILIVLSFGTGAWADISYEGAAGNLDGTDVGGISATGNAWNDSGAHKAAEQGVHLAWGVAYSTATSLWTYTYTFTEGSSDENKWITSFDLGYGGSLGNISITSATFYPDHSIVPPATPTGTATEATFVGLGTYNEPYGTYPGAPATTHSITGLKWTPSSTDTSEGTFILTLQSQDAPVWGDFIAEGSPATGESNPSYSTAWDSQLGIPTTAPPGNGNNGGYVLVPGAAPVAVPVSPWALFLAAAILAVFVARSKDFHKRAGPSRDTTLCRVANPV